MIISMSLLLATGSNVAQSQLVDKIQPCKRQAISNCQPPGSSASQQPLPTRQTAYGSETLPPVKDSMSSITARAGRTKECLLRLIPGSAQNNPTQRPFRSTTHDPESPPQELSEASMLVTVNTLVSTPGHVCTAESRV